jgi:hypothetical protein
MTQGEIRVAFDALADDDVRALHSRLIDLATDDGIAYHDRMTELLIQHFPGMAPALRAVNAFLIEGDAQGPCLRFVDAEESTPS